MKIHQMAVFREVMITGSVSDAARNLNRTQPSVSATISSLEREIGMRLFERKGGRLHPVSEAQYLFEECSQLLSRVEMIQQNMRSLRSLKSGRLDIVSMPGPSVQMLPDLISEFVEDKPAVNCELVSRSSDVVQQLIAAQQYDIGIADYVASKEANSSLFSREVFEFECLCAINRSHPLASVDRISPEMLGGVPLACLYDQHQVTKSLKKVFAERGVNMNPRFSTQYFVPILRFVESGLAVGIVDPIAADGYVASARSEPGVVFRSLSVLLPHRVNILIPAFRHVSLVAEGFTERLRRKFVMLGAKHIQ